MNHIVRLALVQMLFVILIILFTGATLKSREAPLPSYSFPVLVRSYGFLLLWVPVGWCYWAARKSKEPDFDLRSQATIIWSGVSLAAALVFFGFFALAAAWPRTTLIRSTSSTLYVPQEQSR